LTDWIRKTETAESNIFYFKGLLSAGIPMDKRLQGG